MGTDASLDAATNVEIITFMEQENLRVGKAKGFDGIFTTNTNPLTQVRERVAANQLNYFINTISLYCDRSNSEQTYSATKPWKTVKSTSTWHLTANESSAKRQTVNGPYAVGNSYYNL